MNWEKWSINQYISLGTKGKSSGLVSESFPSSLKARLSTCILSEQKPEIRTDCRVLSREEQILPLSEPTTYFTDLTVASRHPNNLLTVCYSLLYMTLCPVIFLHHITPVWKIWLLPSSSSKLTLTIDQILCHVVSELFHLLFAILLSVILFVCIILWLRSVSCSWMKLHESRVLMCFHSPLYS